MVNDSLKTLLKSKRNFTSININSAQESVPSTLRNIKNFFNSEVTNNNAINFCATKDVTTTISRCSSVSEENDSSNTLATTSALPGFASNNEDISSNITNVDSVSDTQCNTSEKTSFAKTVSQASLPTMNDNKSGEILFKVLIEQNEEINGKLDHINMSIVRMHRILVPEDLAPIKPKGLPALPLKNEEAFYAFEEFLKNDDNFLLTIDYLNLLIPDRKTDEAIPVGKLLSKIFSNSLARIVNYSGSGSIKLKLQDTNILTVIECAINQKFPSCNLAELQPKILRWFCTSNQRRLT